MTEQENYQASKSSNWKGEVTSFVLVVLFALAIRTFVIELFFVPTGSMKGTILEGDYVFSTKYNYGYSNYSIPFNPDVIKERIFVGKPEYGDVVIMRPPHKMEERYIKRLIGLPGDKIQIIDDVIYINDKPVERALVGKYVDEAGFEFEKYKETMPNGKSFFSYKAVKNDARYSNFGPYHVTEGHYFFLGDNRDNSGDSRFQLGLVPFKNLIAKGRFIIFSTKETLWDSNTGFFEQIKRFWPWLTSIRGSRIFQKLDNADSADER